MNIVHVSDTHLGYQAYRTVDKKTGLNQREVDNYDAFKQAIDQIIELGPDVVIHSGDLFDSVRPSNRTLAFAFGQLLRLAEANIPIVVISGNHCVPRMRDTGSVFQLLALPTFNNIYPVFKSKYEVFKFGDLTVHALPHCLTKEDLDAGLKKIKPDKKAKYNILTMHAAIAGIPEFSMGDFNEQLIAESYLTETFDYIALGHYHKYTQVHKNAYYAGSMERLSFSEVNQEKGFIQVDLDNNKITFRPLNIRQMIDLPVINARTLDSEQVLIDIGKTVRGAGAASSIVRLTVDNISSATQNSLDYNKIRKLLKNSLHFDLRFNRQTEKHAVAASGTSIGNLSKEFLKYLKQIPIENNKNELMKLGLDYLKKAIDQGST